MSHKTPHRRPGDSHPEQDPALRDALDLWREDTAHVAERLDVTGDLADRVVAAAERGHPPAIVPAGARWYAAAAVLLIAVGITGTLMARADAHAEKQQGVGFVDIEEAYIEALADDPQYSPGLEGR